MRKSIQKKKRITKKIAKAASLTLGTRAAFSLSSISFAQEANCEQYTRFIQGPENILQQKAYDFSTDGFRINNIDQGSGEQDNSVTTGTYRSLLGEEASLTYTIIQGRETPIETKDDQVTILFPEQGRYELEANIKNNNCSYTISKSIQAHGTIYSYIGPSLDDTQQSLLQNAEKQGNFIHTINQRKEKQEDISLKDDHHIQDSSILFIKENNYGKLIQALKESVNTNTDIAIITEQDKGLTKKLIAPFFKEFKENNIALLSPNEFLNTLVQLSVGKEANLSEKHISFEGKRFNASFGYIIDFLVYKGFPIELIAMLLSLSLAIVFLVFRRQIIGRNSFNVYYPILFALCMHTLGLRTSLALLGVALLTYCIMNYSYKKLNILINARIGLTMILYFILTLVATRSYQQITKTTLAFETFASSMFIIPYICILMIGSKIFAKKIKWGSFKRINNTCYFLILSSLIYLIFHSSKIQNMMLIHPNYIIFIILTIIAIGRYTGLQVTEYIRFRPLIKHERSKRKKTIKK